MNCDCGICTDNYSDDREEDYIIERLSHIEEEIAYIKKILAHKRVKEEAMERLKAEAKKEKEEEKTEAQVEAINKLINDIEKKIANQEKRKQINTTRTYPRNLYPWSITTWI